jgi:23S rRNA (guanosine2251-2'-O)-methyltransferase
MSDRRVFGWHAVLAVLKRKPENVEAVWLNVKRKDKRTAELETLARHARLSVEHVPAEQLDELSQGEAHQGVLAQLKSTATPVVDFDSFLDRLKEPALILVLDEVQDPHNFGACLRSAEAAGVDAVITPKDNSAPLSATVRKVASGAAETLPVLRVSNLARALQALKENGVWVIGAAGEASKTLFDADFTPSVALVLGAEGKGLRRLTRELCDDLVRIPMAGTVESLNVSVATGIFLFEAVRQRRR